MYYSAFEIVNVICNLFYLLTSTSQRNVHSSARSSDFIFDIHIFTACYPDITITIDASIKIKLYIKESRGESVHE